MKHYRTKRTKRRRYIARRDPQTAQSFALLPVEVEAAGKLIAEGVRESDPGACCRLEAAKSRPA